MATQWTAKQLKAQDLLAGGVLTNQEIADLLSIHVNTLKNWRRKPGFMDDVISKAQTLLKNELPLVYETLAKGSKSGNPAMIKLLLDHLEKLSEQKNKHSAATLTFTWEPVTPTNGGSNEE